MTRMKRVMDSDPPPCRTDLPIANRARREIPVYVYLRGAAREETSNLRHEFAPKAQTFKKTKQEFMVDIVKCPGQVDRYHHRSGFLCALVM